MNADDLRERTLEFGLRIVHLFRYLQQRTVVGVPGRQLLRCDTSAGANYRAAGLVKSPADFVAEVKIGEEDADEAVYWPELPMRTGECTAARLRQKLQKCAKIAPNFTKMRQRVFESPAKQAHVFHNGQ